MTTATPTIARPGLGCIPSLKDVRDYRFGRLTASSSLPADKDLRPLLFDVWDQGSEGSCTAHGVGAAFRQARRLKYGWTNHYGSGLSIRIGVMEDYTPNFSQLYYDARALEGTTSVDAGASVRDAIRVLNINGAAAWHNTPRYVPGNFTQPPDPATVANASHHEAIRYEAVDLTNPAAIKSAIVLGLPVVFGMTWYQSAFGIGPDGLMPTPGGPGDSVAGGHCIDIVGYDDQKFGGVVVVRNSWGAGWGDHGHFYMPYQLITNASLTGDAWIVEAVTR